MMSKNAKRRLKEFQERRWAEGNLARMLLEGVLVREDQVKDVKAILDPQITTDGEIAEILSDAGLDPDKVGDGRALIKRVSEGSGAHTVTLRRMFDDLSEDVLDPDYPVELVEQDLRDAGLDPEKVRERGRKLGERLLAKGRAGDGASCRYTVQAATAPLDAAEFERALKRGVLLLGPGRPDGPHADDRGPAPETLRAFIQLPRLLSDDEFQTYLNELRRPDPDDPDNQDAEEE